jgi:putative sugar O-methyltransferase
MADLSELDRMLAELEAQDDVYRPTAFWRAATECIIEELREGRLSEFRSLPSSLSFFVPTYGSPGSGITDHQHDALLRRIGDDDIRPTKAELQLQQFLSGKMAALADYRVLLAADDTSRIPFLHKFSESQVGAPLEQFVLDGRRFSRSSLNYLLGLALLKKHLSDDAISTVLEVGGGFGTLGEVLCSAGLSDLRYIDIDIPPTAFVAQYFLSQALSVPVMTHARSYEIGVLPIEDLPPLTVLPSWQIERLTGSVDLFVNFISFQEMEPPVVANYLKHVLRLDARWVLLRNLREGKQQGVHPSKSVW